MLSLRKRAKKSDKLGIGCLGLFGIIWMLFVFGFDGVVLRGVWKTHFASTWFVQTQGIVTSSFVKSTSTSDGRSYSPEVEYTFEVDGAQYVGGNHSYHSFGMSSSKAASKVVARYSEGKAVTVHYDPDDPGESVLEVDYQSFPFMVVLFLTPFHCLGVGFVGGGVVHLLRQRRGDDYAKIAKYIVSQRPDRLVLQDAHWSWWTVFLSVFGGMTFVAVFVVSMALDKETDRDFVMLTWSVCLGLALVLPGLLQIRRGRRHSKLVIDWHHGRFTRKPDSVHIALDSIRVIRLTIHNTNTEINGKPWYRHELEAIDESNDAHRLLIAKGHKKRGEELRDWFAERFDVITEDREDGFENGLDMPEESEVEINRTNS
jgi:5S rRNA maturation endonuclease (ribonuclease M5)